MVKSAKIDILTTSIARACRTDAFVIVTQPGVSAGDYGNRDAAPSLQRRLEAAKNRHSFIIKPAVLGDVNKDQVLEELVTACGMTERNINLHGMRYVESVRGLQYDHDADQSPSRSVNNYTRRLSASSHH